MATYAIGDVQGCFATLERLLSRIRYDASRDRVIFVGDLVNRGPRSLEVLQWARSQGDRVTSVLGNHDLFLLAVATGAAKQRKGDTLDRVLESSDLPANLEWVRRLPLVRRQGDHAIVHAGLLPQWSVARAAELAYEVESALRGADWEATVATLHSERGGAWRDSLSGNKRVGTIASGLLRLRTCKKDGEPCPEFKGPPEDAPRGCLPWFDVPGRASAEHATTIVFGHWAALGLKVAPGVLGLDSGCSWGRALTAARLEDHAIFSEPHAD